MLVQIMLLIAAIFLWFMSAIAIVSCRECLWASILMGTAALGFAYAAGVV